MVYSPVDPRRAHLTRTTFPAELAGQSTSLALLSGRTFDRGTLVAELAGAIANTLADLRENRVAPLVATFARRLGLVDRRVLARTGAAQLEDTLVDIDFEQARFAHSEPVPLAHLLALRAL